VQPVVSSKKRNKMGTLDVIMFIFLAVVLVGGVAGFIIFNNKEED